MRESIQPVARNEKEEYEEEERVSDVGVPCDKEPEGGQPGPEPPPHLWMSASVTTTECRGKISKEPPPWVTFGQEAMSGKAACHSSTCLTMQVGFILYVYFLLFT